MKLLVSSFIFSLLLIGVKHWTKEASPTYHVSTEDRYDIIRIASLATHSSYKAFIIQICKYHKIGC